MSKQLELVDFETAKLLKEKGFDWKTNRFYDYSGKLLYNWDNTDRMLSRGFKCYSPTQALVVKWLRELHSIDIDSWSNQEGSWSYTLSMVYGKILKEGDNFTTFEVSELANINEALKLI